MSCFRFVLSSFYGQKSWPENHYSFWSTSVWRGSPNLSLEKEQPHGEGLRDMWCIKSKTMLVMIDYDVPHHRGNEQWDISDRYIAQSQCIMNSRRHLLNYWLNNKPSSIFLHWLCIELTCSKICFDGPALETSRFEDVSLLLGNGGFQVTCWVEKARNEQFFEEKIKGTNLDPKPIQINHKWPMYTERPAPGPREAGSVKQMYTPVKHNMFASETGAFFKRTLRWFFSTINFSSARLLVSGDKLTLATNFWKFYAFQNQGLWHAYILFEKISFIL